MDQSTSVLTARADRCHGNTATPSELPGEFSKDVSQFKFSSETVGQTVLGMVNELSEEEPLEITLAE